MKYRGVIGPTPAICTNDLFEQVNVGSPAASPSIEFDADT